uniref:Protocadherin domain-containing protein n=1 Tax=Poecilia latipinna TaxID=48699 RepID=A0A3B3U1U8_9TELE
MTGKCTRECNEYGHSDSCWMPVRTSPERRPSSSGSAEQPGSQETLAMAAMANGDPTTTHMMGDRNRNLLNKKMASSSSSYEAFGSPSYGSPGGGEEMLGHPTEEIPLAPTGEYKPTSCGTLTRREVYL